ncbi:PSD1 and planctomycete cytochrome C domain-containing protein [Rubripirellula reticaptiva]|uniref:Planctomycete cytochrome C n=1 Tax=Rubripirellula reticaptiva TaxID=2528013 RepID=A0A5C6EVU5_9BACT|nr:PSD1 and planctomycete cytochrome C domain-containing protein [Rubripirellula reticaptiva]TWU51786.1 Planctomycete cytochrome C [Rubripirellula reticaptiva]
MRNLELLARVLLFGIIASPLWADDVSFNRDIRPILSDRCYFCHGFDENHREAGLRLDQAEAASDAIEPGKPDDSELLRRIISDDEDEVMPPRSAHKKPISDDEINLIRRWIQQGAQYEDHWAFVAPVKNDVKDAETSQAIDHFVGQRQSKHGLQFAPPATPAKWLRRVSLDLIGLPPTLAELDGFEKDVLERGDISYESAIDRVLASPHYGERMSLEWLDVARYADTNGFQMDAYRMNWPWRDWVTRALNSDMPFDQFTREQLAGDLLDDPTEDQMIATAFNRNHMINGEGGSIAEENLAKNNFDRVETTGTTWLGLTVGCCQCHDHKFDPLKQRDYYSMYSFFNQISETGRASKQFTAKKEQDRYEERFWVDKPYVAIATDQQTSKLDQLRQATKAAKDRLEATRSEFEPKFLVWIKEIQADPKLLEERIDNLYIRRNVNLAPLDNLKHKLTRGLVDYFISNHEPWSGLKKAVAEAEKAEQNYEAQIPLVMVMRDDQQRDTFILERGNYETPGEKVSPSVPEFLPPLPEGVKADRLAFANWLVSPEHPLTSRVTVNRYWQLMFGRGLVTTPDDFGLQGELPSHPDLLDWMAVDFRERGWSVKRLLRSIALSKTYRQSAAVDESVVAKDPKNIWLARGPRQRLDSRLLRDQALALSGLLVPELGGPPVAPYQPPGIWEPMSLNKNHYMQDDGDDLYRRSLYTVWRRVVAPANFFDAPSRQSCNVKPQRTSTPLHALTTLNDTTYVEAARVWADALSMLPDDASRLARMFYAATARQPDANEIKSLQSSLDQARKHFANHSDESAELLTVGDAISRSGMESTEHAAWTTVCLLVLNLDETLSK